MGAEELKRIFMSLPCIKEVFKINGLMGPSVVSEVLASVDE